MGNFFREIQEIYQLFSGSGLVMTGFAIAVCYLLYKSKNQLLRKYFLYPSLIVFIVVNNPITIGLLVETGFMEQERYVRLYWLLPISVIIAYACTMFIERVRKQRSKYIVGFLIICMMFFSGSYIFASGNFQKATNPYKLPQKVINVTDRIVEDIEKDGGKVEETRIVVPSDLSGYIRQYNGDIKLLYGRRVEYNTDVDGYLAEQVKDAMDEGSVDCELVATKARKSGCKYVVVEKEKKLEGELEGYGYELMKVQDGYSIYKDVLEDTQWVVTQYESLSGIQAMFYTLTSTDGKLIVVDGGHKVDTDTIREIAGKHDNVIDLWICTHFHQDHVEAFTDIMENPGDIAIKEIWCPSMDAATYDSFAQEWDNVEVAHKFFALTEGKDNVRHLQTGDEVQFDNLNFKIFSAFDPERKETYEGNNCCLVFKVMGNENSMLFCADAGIDLDQFLRNTWGDELKADYIQMGHHGNGGLSEETYRLVHPEVAFFDAHDALFFDTTGKYTTPENRRIMESMECTIYRMGDAPHRVNLK